MPAAASPARYCDRCGARLARDNRAALCGPCSSPAALRDPPAVPPGFWDVAAIRDALDTWHMGRVIHAYRHHPWHGQVLRQSVVGDWFGLTQTQVSRIENGRAPEEISKLVRWARLLGIPPERLWFGLPGDGSTVPAPVSPLTVPVIVGGRTVLLPVDERGALAAISTDRPPTCCTSSLSAARLTTGTTVRPWRFPWCWAFSVSSPGTCARSSLR